MPAAARREAILDAALEEFAGNGFHETSLEGVAERAGISKALIYEHFPSKRDLHEALLSRYRQKLLERVIATGSAPTPEGRLRAGADAFFAFVEENREPWRLMVRNPMDIGGGEAAGRRQAEMAHAVAALIHADTPPQLEDGAAGEEGDLRAELAGQQLVGAMRALANWWDEHREIPRARLVMALMNFCWNGMDRVRQGDRWEP
jgi:AcrR family transcriptional regulator